MTSGVLKMKGKQMRKLSRPQVGQVCLYLPSWGDCFSRKAVVVQVLDGCSDVQIVVYGDKAGPCWVSKDHLYEMSPLDEGRETGSLYHGSVASDHLHGSCRDYQMMKAKDAIVELTEDELCVLLREIVGLLQTSHQRRGGVVE